jgi:hypothetical protein
MQTTTKRGRAKSKRAKQAAKLLRKARRYPGVKEAMIAAKNAVRACPCTQAPDVAVIFSDRTS